MRRRAEHGAALLCTFALLGGCAATKPDAQIAASGDDASQSGFPAPSGKCIFLDTIDDWKAVDPTHLLVRTRATGWQWKITLDRRCSDILYANTLAWDTPDSRVCDYRADAITVPRDRCSIGSIEPYQEPSRPAPTAGGW